MPSWQARGVAVLIRATMRRWAWGDEQALARRARRVFVTPRVFRWLRTRHVRIDTVRDGPVHGEWVTGFRPGNIAEFRRVYVGDTKSLSPYASPVLGDFCGLPPLLIHVGSIELLLDDARRVHERIQRAGGVSRLEVFDGLFHSWHMMDGVVPEARTAFDRVVAFLNDPEPAPAAGSGRSA